MFITYEDHRDTDEAAMENVASQSGTTINSQSIKSLHIDMNVVDELSSMEDNIIDKGTIIYLFTLSIYLFLGRRGLSQISEKSSVFKLL